MQRVEGVVQHYAWGDTAFIPNLLGLEPDGRPWAEYWLGTHPNGPSRLDDGIPLVEITGDLPYLLKVLAAAEPLSLQAHPNSEQAAAGFGAGIFPDPHPKPELLCALTPFQAFCGVRPTELTLSLLDEIGVSDLARVLRADGPAAALESLYRGAIDHRRIVDVCAPSDRPETEWVRRLAAAYPDDPSVAATLLLNLVVLEPGQAMHLGAGNLHAYLHGAGIELMGASDNVVRGGLTTKPVDVDLLMEIADPTPMSHPVLAESTRYALPATSLALQRLGIGELHQSTGHELAFDLTGTTWYLASDDRLVADEITYVVTTP